MSDHTLFNAKTKPPKCSEVRWRIELRRREQKKAMGGMFLPGDAHRNSGVNFNTFNGRCYRINVYNV